MKIRNGIIPQHFTFGREGRQLSGEPGLIFGWWALYGKQCAPKHKPIACAMLNDLGFDLPVLKICRQEKQGGQPTDCRWQRLFIFGCIFQNGIEQG